MNRPVAIVNQTSGSDAVSMDVLRLVAAAVQRQVIEHFSPTWGHTGAVIALSDGDPLPRGYWAIYLCNQLEDSRLGGVHYYSDRGEAYAYVSTERRHWDPDIPWDQHPWSLGVSHEVLEMIADPTTEHFESSLRPDGKPGTVDYLVEVCDPRQHYAFSYSIDGIMVSDFYSRDYFSRFPGGMTRFSMTGALQRPLQVLPGGYLTWRDNDGQWYQTLADKSGKIDHKPIEGFMRFPGDSIREKIDYFSGTQASTGMRIRLGGKYRTLAKKRREEHAASIKRLAQFSDARKETQARHWKSVCAPRRVKR